MTDRKQSVFGAGPSSPPSGFASRHPGNSAGKNAAASAAAAATASRPLSHADRFGTDLPADWQRLRETRRKPAAWFRGLRGLTSLAMLYLRQAEDKPPKRGATNDLWNPPEETFAPPSPPDRRAPSAAARLCTISR